MLKTADSPVGEAISVGIALYDALLHEQLPAEGLPGQVNHGVLMAVQPRVRGQTVAEFPTVCAQILERPAGAAVGGAVVVVAADSRWPPGGNGCGPLAAQQQHCYQQ